MGFATLPDMNVSAEHEVRVRLIQDCPELAPQLLKEQLKIPVPSYNQAVLQKADLGEAVPVERRADAVVALLDSTTNVKLEQHGHT